VPLFRDMDEADQEMVLRGYNFKLLAIMEGRGKLRQRRKAVILTDDEAFEIETGLLRLQFAADDLLDEKAALQLSTRNIRAPKDEELSEMRDAVDAIHEINVKNKKAKVILAAVEDVAGDLPTLD
jgi:hypothetical protein